MSLELILVLIGLFSGVYIIIAQFSCALFLSVLFETHSAAVSFVVPFARFPVFDGSGGFPTFFAGRLRTMGSMAFPGLRGGFLTKTTAEWTHSVSR